MYACYLPPSLSLSHPSTFVVPSQGGLGGLLQEDLETEGAILSVPEQI